MIMALLFQKEEPEAWICEAGYMYFLHNNLLEDLFAFFSFWLAD